MLGPIYSDSTHLGNGLYRQQALHLPWFLSLDRVRGSESNQVCGIYLPAWSLFYKKKKKKICGK